MNSHKYAPPKSSESRAIFEDPIVKEVHDARHKLASQLGNDLQESDVSEDEAAAIREAEADRQSANHAAFINLSVLKAELSL